MKVKLCFPEICDTCIIRCFFDGGNPISRQFEQLEDAKSGGVKPWQILLIGAATLAVIIFGISLRFYEPTPSDPQQNGANGDNAAKPLDQSETTPTNQPALQPSPDQIAWRGQALEVLETLMARLQTLEEKGVQLWAPEEYQQLVETITSGEQHYGEQRFREARDTYQEAMLQVEALENKVDQTFEDYASRGTQLIREKQYDEAVKFLDIARLIEPANKDIAAAINTAKNGEAVDRLMIKASFAIDENQPSEALSFLQEAAALDPTRSDVHRLIVDAQNLSQQLTFRSNMQAGHAALESKNFTRAISMFKKALAIEPNRSEAVNALALAEKQKLENDLRNLEVSATTAMQEEEWQKAIQHYQNALKLQSGAAFAEAGLKRAIFFNEKQKQLVELLAKPERLADNAVAGYARTILNELGATDLPPRLSKTNANLKQALSAYSKPVEVTLLSDNRSTITLLRRERFSPFRKKALQLKPGQYTLVARRKGYRDKRISFTVPVNGSAISITIGVDEKL